VSGSVLQRLAREANVRSPAVDVPVPDRDQPTERTTGAAGSDVVLLLLRQVAASGLAGAVAGILVLGVGGRVVMRLAAMVAPDARGLLTDNGNVVGVITAEGTVALVLFGGLFFGVIGAVVWVAVESWLPTRGLRRVLAAGVTSVGLASFVLVAPDNPDFRILGRSPVIVALLVVLIAAFGVALAVGAEWLDRRLPFATRNRPGTTFAYAALVFAGSVLILPLTIGIYFRGSPPVAVALLVTGSATVSWWFMRARGARRPPERLAGVGRGALVLATALGFVRLATDMMLILGEG
jgi:hypothetical protein